MLVTGKAGFVLEGRGIGKGGFAVRWYSECYSSTSTVWCMLV